MGKLKTANRNTIDAEHDTPGQMPQWNPPITDPRRAFKMQQREYRKAVLDAKHERLEAGERKFQIGIIREGTDDYYWINDRGDRAKFILVGGSSEGEAIHKFAKFAGITAGLDMVEVIKEVTT